MAVTLTKHKTAALLTATKTKGKGKSKTKPAKPQTVEQAVDQYVEVDQKLTLLAIQGKELEKRKKEALEVMETEIADVPADETCLMEGTEYNIEASEKQNVAQVVATNEIRKAIGDDLFFKIAKVGIGDLEKYVEPKVLEKIMKRERTGRRTFKIVPKPE